MFYKKETVDNKGKKFGNRHQWLALAFVVVFVLGLGLGRVSDVIHIGGYKPETGLSATLDYTSVNQLYEKLRQNYDGKLTDQQMIDGLKHGLATATGDPYTEYFTAKEAQAFSDELQGTFSGIGAQLDNDADGNIVIVAPLEGSPAKAAGVQAGDIIATIDGKSTSGMTSNDAVTKIRGTKGTKVTLGLIRNKTQALTLTITRGDISLPTATGKILDGNIGYLQVSQFSDGTFDLVQKAVSDFQSKGVSKVVLDLRDNPGGEVTSAVDISSLWLDKNATIMQEKRGSAVVDEYDATGTNPLKGLKTVVLVNGGSASASEITAAALHDNKAAYIIGEKSYGKGVVQQVIPLDDGGQLKVTVASWYRPNGQNINKKGITPDKTVSRTADDYKAGKDPQLDAATSYLNQ